MENSKYDGLFTTDKNLIQTVIESSPYSEEIDPKVILNINKQLILDRKPDVRRTVDWRDDGGDPTSSGRRASSSYPESYTHITNDAEFDMLVKYHNIFYKNKKIKSILKKKTRNVEDFRFVVQWVDLHLLGNRYIEEDFPDDPVGTAEDYV